MSHKGRLEAEGEAALCTLVRSLARVSSDVFLQGGRVRTLPDKQIFTILSQLAVTDIYLLQVSQW